MFGPFNHKAPSAQWGSPQAGQTWVGDPNIRGPSWGLSSIQTPYYCFETWKIVRLSPFFRYIAEAQFGFLWTTCIELYWCSSPTSSLPPTSLPAPPTRRYDSLDSATNGRSDIDSGSGSSRRTSRQYSLDSRHSLSDRWVSVPPLRILPLLFFLLLRPVTPSRCDVSGGLVPSSSLAVLACMRSCPISVYVYIIYIFLKRKLLVLHLSLLCAWRRITNESHQ